MDKNGIGMNISARREHEKKNENISYDMIILIHVLADLRTWTKMADKALQELHIRVVSNPTTNRRLLPFFSLQLLLEVSLSPPSLESRGSFALEFITLVYISGTLHFQ